MKKFLLLFLVNCETVPPEPPPHACTSPGDENAMADITITAKDAPIDIGDGKTFDAWTFDGDVPGPVLHMNVGETKRIKLVNRSPRAASLHFHGVTYSASDDGTPEHEEGVVYPNCAHVYTIKAEAPGAWPYHSHVDSRTEMAMGQYGAVIVSAANETKADEEYVAFFGQLGLEGEGEEEEEGAFYMTINGRPNGHASVIKREGDRYTSSAGMAHGALNEHIRWHVLDVSPDDPHTFHVHGHRWCDRGGLADAMGICPNGGLYGDDNTLLPAQGITVDWIEASAGEWMFHCHILDHVMDGMWAMYHVQ